MQTVLKSGEMGKRLGVTPQTIRRWVHRYADFFGESAKDKNRYQVIYTPEDVLILVTIQHLSQSGYSLDEVEVKLREGFRYEHEMLKTLGSEAVSKALTTDRFADRLIQADLQQAIAERNQALEASQIWKEQYLAEKQQKETLIHENATLQYRLGAAEAELNLLRRQQGQ